MRDVPEHEIPEDLPQGDNQALLLQYADEIKEQSKIPFFTPLRAWNTPAVRWCLGTAILLALCGVEAWLLLRPMPSQAPPPTAAVLAIERNDACSQRQAAIVRAVAMYKRHYGRVPEDLDVLGPPYINEAVVDPESGRAYEFRHEGDSIVVSCPNPSLHPFTGLPHDAG